MRASVFITACMTGILLLAAYLQTLDSSTREEPWLPQPASAHQTSDVGDHRMSNDKETTPREQCTTEQRRVAFIKVHKAGSSTVANILFRFGMNRNLTFLLPNSGVTIALTQSKPWKNNMPLPAGKKDFDILTNHAVYERSEIRRLFPNDTAVIAVLRKPMGQLESAIYYYYKNRIPGEDKVGQYLKNPPTLINSRMVNNSMAYELGIPLERFQDVVYIQSHLEKIAHEIGFVLILERLDESLVLLKRRFCWQLHDILYITRNVNTKKPHISRTEAEMKIHEEISKADYMLYDFFYKRLEDEISKESADFSDEVVTYNKILSKVSEYCLQTEHSGGGLQIAATRWNRIFYIPKTDCKIMLLNGRHILNYAKSYQYGRN